MSTYQILEFAAESWPEYPAIIDEEGSMSYLELFQQAELLKKTLTQAGLNPGMGLGVMGRNSRMFVTAMFAGFGCGAIVLPLSHQLKQSEVETILADTCLHAVLDDQTGCTPICGETLTITFLQQTLRFAFSQIVRDQPVTDFSDAAFIRHTSGTTGLSKGVVLSHQSIQERVETTQNALKLTPEDAVLWVLPMAFHFLVTILVYIRSGAKIIICKDLLAQTIIDDANQYKATLLYAAPMHYRLLAADLSNKRMDTLKYVLSTSSGISINSANAFKQRFNLPVTQAYGIIEVGLPLLDNLSGNSDPQSVGYPVTGFEISLLDEDNEPVRQGETGQLAIRGPGMFDAYLKPWQTARQVMKQGWFMTGDLAQLKVDGRLIICGRKKSMINVSGNKAFPEEIELVLNSYTDITDSHVFAQMHPLMGEIVCAEVIVAEDAVIDVETVLQFCRSQLSTYKIPQRLIQVTQIAHTQSGKIKRS